ncbi:hypothetical protein SUGI_0435210 [Cryptomeria japonica]|uniref:uncharacterized protein LOC131046876 n=1 Tax=Cryptomeria japonica TaxID=3369 RepID=UPI002408C496|nr:uncharacterized protein LOC131046876 [Cryptomeria japonica]GLJ23064.1 hypothetical protein SUGI_0435210 [Cryptomeria japonica]
MDDSKLPNVKVLYGTIAKDYAQFRPRYPPHLFSFLSSLTPQHHLAWDVGTGTGQAAIELSKYYARVVGTDTSEGQIQHAERRHNISYAVTPSSMTDQQLHSIVGPESSVDLVTAATAVHWFDLDKFYGQVKRVLKKPGGVIAVWAYWKPRVDPAVDAVYERFFSRTYPFSHPAAKVVLEEYETLQFPFAQVEGIKMEIEEQRTFEEYVGYFRTGQALVGREEILEEFIAEFEAAWGAPLHVTKTVKFPLCFKIGKV